MTYEIFLNSLDGIDFAPDNEYAEIYQSIRTLLSTIKCSVPLDRELGIDAEYVDKPTPKAEAMLSEEIIDAIGKYEPRAVVDSISFDGDYDGKLIPKVRITINE